MAAGPIVLIEEAIEAQPEGSGVDDQLLQRCIDAASEVIEGYCGRAFHTATYKALHSGDEAARAGHVLYLAESERLRATFPVTAVTGVTESGSSLTVERLPHATGNFTSGELAVVLDHRGQVYRANGSDNRAVPKRWVAGWANILVEYTAGYATAAMPAGLKQACIDLAWLFYKEGGRFGIESLSLSEVSARYIRMLPPWSKAGLDQLRFPRRPVTVVG